MLLIYYNIWMKYLYLLLLLSSTSSADVLKIGIVDTGLDVYDARFAGHICQDDTGPGAKDFTGTGIQDTMGHGTFIAGLIQQYAGSAHYCLYIAKYFMEDAPDLSNYSRLIAALQWLIEKKVKIINYSGGGYTSIEEEYLIIKEHPKVDFVVAAGNNGENLDHYNYFPASYLLPNVYAVGCKHNGKVCYFSNYGSLVRDWEDGQDVTGLAPHGTTKMSGTSMSTAIATGKAIRNFH